MRIARASAPVFNFADMAACNVSDSKDFAGQEWLFKVGEEKETNNLVEVDLEKFPLVVQAPAASKGYLVPGVFATSLTQHDHIQ